MRSGGVDRDGAAADALGDTGDVDGDGQVGGAHAAYGSTDRISAECRTGCRRDGLVVDDGGERLCSGDGLVRSIDHDGGEVDVHRLKDRGQRVDRHTAGAEREPEGVDAVLEVGGDVGGGALGIGIGEPAADVPAAPGSRGRAAPKRHA